MAPLPTQQPSVAPAGSTPAAALDAARNAVVMEVKDAAAGVTTGLAAPSPQQLAQQLDRQLDQTTARLFVSPRVIDERAFEQLASTLKALSAEAAAQARSLSQASAGVQTLTDNLRALTKDIAARTEQAIKVLPLLESRVASAQSLVDRVTRDAAIAKAREARDAIAAEVLTQTQAAVAQQMPAWQAEFLAQAKSTLLASAMPTELPAQLQAFIREQAQQQAQQLAQQHVHGAVEAAVREAVQEALTTLRADVQASLPPASSARALFPKAPTTDAPMSLTAADAARQALDSATARAASTAQQLETTVEAVAGEIAQQLAALRSDASVIIGGATARIEGLASSAAEHALVHTHELAKAQLLAELQRHVSETLEPEVGRQEAATIEAIQTAQHAAHESLGTLIASAEEGVRAAAERLGAAIIEARTLSASLTHTAMPATTNTSDVPSTIATQPTTELQAALAEQIAQGNALLATLSDRIEASAHAADAIAAQLAQASPPKQEAQLQTQTQLQAQAAIAQLSTLLAHAAQAGPWLQSLLQQAAALPRAR